jgi:hypothetical protein
MEGLRFYELSKQNRKKSLSQNAMNCFYFNAEIDILYIYLEPRSSVTDIQRDLFFQRNECGMLGKVQRIAIHGPSLEYSGYNIANNLLKYCSDLREVTLGNALNLNCQHMRWQETGISFVEFDQLKQYVIDVWHDGEDSSWKTANKCQKDEEYVDKWVASEREKCQRLESSLETKWEEFRTQSEDEVFPRPTVRSVVDCATGMAILTGQEIEAFQTELATRPWAARTSARAATQAKDGH